MKRSQLFTAKRLTLLMGFLLTGFGYAADLSFDVPSGTNSFTNNYFDTASSNVNLIKSGAGTLELRRIGDQVVTGTTTIQEGTLVLNRSVGAGNRNLPQGTIDIQAGARLVNSIANQMPDVTAITLSNSTLTFNASEYLSTITLRDNSLINGTSRFVLNGTSSGGLNAVGGGFAGTMSAELALASNWSDTSTTSGPRTGNGTTPIFVDAGTAFTLSGKIVDGLESSPIGSLNKTGTGTLTLSGNGEYRGTTTVAAGTLKLDGNLQSYFWNGSANVYGANGAISVASGATLAGSGSTKGAINGAGTVAPGASPGILTAGSLDASAGTDFQFEFTAANPSYGDPANSGNDLLRLRDATPFTAALDSQNLISIYLNVSGLTGSDIFRGGFFTDADGSLLSMVQGASYSYFVKGDGLGSFSYNGVTYYSLDQYNTNTSQNISFGLASETVTGNFSTGAETGQILSFSTVPEPGSASLAALGLAALLLRRRRGGSYRR